MSRTSPSLRSAFCGAVKGVAGDRGVGEDGETGMGRIVHVPRRGGCQRRSFDPIPKQK
jgi:hypothetical protein